MIKSNLIKILRDELNKIVDLFEAKIDVAYIGSNGKEFYLYNDKEKVLLKGDQEDIIDSLLILANDYNIKDIENIVYDIKKNKKEKYPISIDYNILRQLI